MFVLVEKLGPSCADHLFCSMCHLETGRHERNAIGTSVFGRPVQVVITLPSRQLYKVTIICEQMKAHTGDSVVAPERKTLHLRGGCHFASKKPRNFIHEAPSTGTRHLRFSGARPLVEAGYLPRPLSASRHRNALWPR